MKDQELLKAATACIDKTAIGPGSRDKIIGIVYDTLSDISVEHKAELEAAEKEVEILKEQRDELSDPMEQVEKLKKEVCVLEEFNDKLQAMEEDDRQRFRMNIWQDTFNAMTRPNQYQVDDVTKWANAAVDEFDKKFLAKKVDSDTEE